MHLIARNLRRGLRCGRLRLRDLGADDIDFGRALTGLQIVQLRLAGIELALGLLLSGGLIRSLEAKQGRRERHGLTARHTQALEPSALRGGYVHELALDVALRGGRGMPGAGHQQARGNAKEQACSGV